MHRLLFIVLLALFYPYSAFADSHYEFKNTGDKPIVVNMDRYFEEHVIKPGGSAVFTQAKKQEQPTFWVFVDHNKDGKPDGETPSDIKRIPLTWIMSAKGMLEWDGKNTLIH